MIDSSRTGGRSAAENPSLTLRHVSLRLPTGRVLFDAVSHAFGPGITGLVGANGAGKSMMARLLAGDIAPDSGTVAVRGLVRYLAQHTVLAPDATVAAVAGLADVAAAQVRLDAGTALPADLALLDGRWTVLADLRAALRDAGLAPSLTDPPAPARGLSGGELARVALTGAFLSGADTLVLDEPTNHLDTAGRAWLVARLRQWRGSAVIVSHDRALLALADGIVELAGGTVRAYGGNYSLYQGVRDAEAAAARQALEHARVAREAGVHALHRQHEARQARTARQGRDARAANQAAIVLGKRKNTAEASAGRAARRDTATRERLDDAVRAAARRVTDDDANALVLPASAVPPGRTVIACDGAVPPWPPGAAPLDLVLAGPVRLAIAGPNGCGKSTLLRMLAGAVAPSAGTCAARVPFAWLDQQLPATADATDVLQLLGALDTPLGQGELRTRLALLGLDAARVTTPPAQLSGGERIKAALACALWRRTPAQLLLLDEPTNHLDLAAIGALEQALRGWPGALAVVSHDSHFLDALAPTHTLAWHASGWRLETH